MPSIQVRTYSRGYPRLAALATLDKEYLIFRQFNYLHARVLLDLQDRLQAYEKDLRQHDKLCRNEESLAERANGLRPIQKTDLFNNIEETLKRYREV
ncbi:hypothetical protein Daesc_007067 [Daldinia eschscholtzii]|uniref:DUF6594 domain-containing protein n=1 Tax=Daldinia eschscholtzii TaxID=292717 RepID=A0AAX6MJD5_9PEZI